MLSLSQYSIRGTFRNPDFTVTQSVSEANLARIIIRVYIPGVVRTSGPRENIVNPHHIGVRAIFQPHTPREIISC